jgi:hypothetical protein
MALTGYVPQIGERDLERVVRSIRNAHELLLLTGGKLLAEASGSNVSAIDFMSDLDDTYGVYAFEFDLRPINDGDAIYMMVREGGVLQTSNYHYAGSAVESDGMLNAFVATTSSIIRLSAGIGNAADEGASGWVRLYNRAGGKRARVLYQGAGVNPSGNANNVQASASRNSIAAVDGVRFGATSGNVTGTVQMYGIPRR